MPTHDLWPSCGGLHLEAEERGTWSLQRWCYVFRMEDCIDSEVLHTEAMQIVSRRRADIRTKQACSCFLQGTEEHAIHLVCFLPRGEKIQQDNLSRTTASVPAAGIECTECILMSPFNFGLNRIEGAQSDTRIICTVLLNTVLLCKYMLPKLLNWCWDHAVEKALKFSSMLALIGNSTHVNMMVTLGWSHYPG